MADEKEVKEPQELVPPTPVPLVAPKARPSKSTSLCSALYILAAFAPIIWGGLSTGFNVIFPEETLFMFSDVILGLNVFFTPIIIIHIVIGICLYTNTQNAKPYAIWARRIVSGLLALLLGYCIFAGRYVMWGDMLVRFGLSAVLPVLLIYFGISWWALALLKRAE